MARSKTRRQFVQSLLAGPLAAGTLAAGQDPPPDPREASGQALTDLARARFRYLTEEQIKQVRGSVAADLAGIEQIGRVPLTNADEPDFIFPLEPPA